MKSIKYIVYYDYEECKRTATTFKEDAETWNEARQIVENLKQCDYCSNFVIAQVY